MVIQAAMLFIFVIIFELDYNTIQSNKVPSSYLVELSTQAGREQIPEWWRRSTYQLLQSLQDGRS